MARTLLCVQQIKLIMRKLLFLLLLLPFFGLGKSVIVENSSSFIRVDGKKVTKKVASIAPTSISGTTTICNGSSTTLTAVGATVSSGDSYQWGVGSTVGNSILSSQNGVSITVSPSTTTTYWVRVVGPSRSTTGVTVVVTVVNPSTAPTSITGITTLACPGLSTTLTATGGTLASGAVYQWRTGDDDNASNIIAGQTGSSITVSPLTSTKYSVRRVDSGVCTTSTSSASVNVTVNQPGGDQVTYGDNSWIGYVYPGFTSTVNPPADAFNTTYKGYVTVPTLNFNQNWASGAISGANLCGTYSDYFAVRYKAKLTLQPGYYNFTVGGDDGYRLRLSYSANGADITAGTANSGLTEMDDDNSNNSGAYFFNNWADHGYTSSTVTVYIQGDVYATFDYYERTGQAQASFTYTPCSAPSTAATAITGVKTICNGSSTTLTATGATLNTGATYQWGTGAVVGNSIIAGQTAATITVSPTYTTTYWVRVVDAAPCSNNSAGFTTTVTVVNPSTAPTSISGNTSVCLGSSTTLTATGGSATTGVTYQWGTGSDVGTNPIAGQTANSIVVTPTTDTTYWVRRLDNGTCTAYTTGVTVPVTIVIPTGDQTTYGTNSWIGYVYSNHNTTANPVSEDVFATNYRGFITENETFDVSFPSCVISGDNVCGTYNVKYAIRFKMNKTFAPGYYNLAIGGDDGVRLSIDGGATYVINKWNVQAYTTGNQTVYLSGNTNLILEYFQGPLSNARVSFTYTTCSTSTAPTAITGTTSTCSGTPTTLTATGGTEGSGSTYQWGTGTIVGNNIISGQTAASITVSPNNTTTYWVRRVDASPCSLITNGITTTVTTTPKSTAPTWTSGTTTICTGNSTTISANGGTAGAGCTYQWGTGSVAGTNVIAGQTTSSITLSPTTTTTYWVRRLDNGICTNYSDAMLTTITVIVPPGNPSVFGDNQWNVYGYSTGDITLATALYAGYYTSNTLNLDTQSGTNLWSNYSSPSSAAGWSGCTVPTDNFTFVSKRKGFPCGNYTLKLLNWDDTAMVFVNGTQVWSANSWSGSPSTTATIGTYNFDANSTIEVRVREITGISSVSISLTQNSTFVPSTDPTSITGTTTLCSGSSTTLTATGGTLSNVGVYQWGTGATGANIIAGQTAASITVTPATDTTYWVRRVDTACNNTTGAASQLVSITSSVGGSLTANQNICSGVAASDIVLTGNVGNVIKWQKSTDPSFATSTDINNTTNTLSASVIGLISTTTYYRAVVQNGNCATANSTATGIIVAPGSVGGTVVGSTRLCAGTNTATMTIGGKTGNVIKWQSSSLNDFSANVVDINNTTMTLTVTNLTATTYYRAVVQNGACPSVYSSVGTITVDPATVAGTITGSKNYCASSANATVLTLTGKTGSVVKWQSSTVNDFSSAVTDIASNSVTLVQNNITTTTYYRALVQSGVCSSAYSTTGVISIDSNSVAGTVTGGTSVCPGTNSTTLTVAGNNGTIQWQSSTNNSTFANITGATSSTYTATNLSTTTYFRVLVQNGICSSATSNTTTVAVDAVSVGGNVRGNSTVCAGTNSTTLTASSYSGAIQWQSSTDNIVFNDITGATSSTYVASNLNVTTYYRISATYGACVPSYSTVAIVTVYAPSNGGTVLGSANVCLGTNSTTLTISGNVGNVTKWQSSTVSDFSSAVTDINNTTTSLTATNIAVNTYYRAIVTNGVCSSSTSSIASLTVIQPLGSIGNITGLSSVCGQSSSTYSIAPVTNATDYTWTFTSGLSVYSSAGNSVVVNIDSLFRDGVITVKAFNGCQESSVQTILITKKPRIASMQGPISTCGITTGTYTASSIPGATYNWTVPAGMTITSGQGTSSIVVSYDPTYVTGNVAVTATNSCGVSDVLEYRVNNIQMPTAITGLAQIANATTGVYTTPSVSGASYVWTVPAGITITSGQGTHVINVAFASSFTSGTVTVALVTSCGTSTPRTFDINRSQALSAIVGPQSLCGIAEITYDTVGNVVQYNPSLAIYSVPATSDATSYVWTVPAGATIVSGQGTNSIAMTFDINTFVNGNITVSSTTQFGTSTVSTLPIKRVGGTISGIVNVCDLTTATYSIPLTIGTNFNWTVPAWMSITAGQGTNTITVAIASPYSNDNITVNFVSNCGTNESISLNIGCNKATNIKDSQCGTTLTNLDSSVYPNPVPGAQAYKYKVTLGSNVREYTPTTALFNLTQLPGGVTYNTTYTVQVAVEINGVWGGYGSPCTITTPSPITKVKTANCGTTLATISTSVYADALIGVQAYRFEVTNGTNVRTYDATTNLFNLTQLSGGAAYNTTYSIRVAAEVNGVWGSYGTSCNVTTPDVTMTKVIDSQCGTTLTAINSSVYYVNVYGAQAYRFEVTYGTTVTTYDLTNLNNLFNLTMISGGASYNTTYSIRVASNVNGVWSNYGTACTISTPAAITKVKAIYCGTVLAGLNTSIYADALIGVQGYRFEVTNGTTIRTYDATSNLFNLTQLSGGASYSTSYTIRVAVKTNDTWGAYGATCNVTTPGEPVIARPTEATETATENTVVEFKVKASPNPYSDNFKLELTSSNTTDVQVSVYDMMGKLVENKTIQASDLETQELGRDYATGVYNVIVTQGNDVKTLRLIKR